MKINRNTFSAFLVLLAALLAAGCATTERSTRASAPPALAPLPEAVTSFGAVADAGYLYVFGGHRGERHEYSAQEVSGSFHRLRLAGGNQWEALSSSDPAQGVALVAADGCIYRVGGMAARNGRGEKQDLRSKRTVERFDVRKGGWEAMPELPAPRSSHDAAVLGRVLYVGGGWQLPGGTNRGQWHDALLSLDLSKPRATWQPLAQPFKRRALAMAASGGRLYFLGGMDAEGKPSLAVDVYDPATGQWSTGPDLPTGPMKGFGCAAVVQNGRLYYSGMKGDLHRLSADGRSWELTGRLQHPRFFHRLVPLGSDRLIAAGGEDSEGKRGDLELLAPSVKPLAAEPAAVVNKLN